MRGVVKGRDTLDDRLRDHIRNSVYIPFDQATPLQHATLSKITMFKFMLSYLHTSGLQRPTARLPSPSTAASSGQHSQIRASSAY